MSQTLTRETRARRGRRSAAGQESTPSTPASTPTSSAAIAESPIRRSRVEEKQELQELNHRLEFYILQRRNTEAQRQALIRDLEVAKKRARLAQTRAESAFAEELDQLRSERDRLSATAAQRLSDFNAAASEIEILREKVGSDQEHLAKTQSSLENLNQKFHETDAENRRLREAAANHDHVKNQDGKTIKSLRQDLDKMRKERDAIAEAHTASEAAFVSHDTDLERIQKQYKDLSERSRKERETLGAHNSEMEALLRQEFTNQLNQRLAERQVQYEKEKDSMMADLKEVYDEKLAAHRNRLQKLGHEKEVSDEQARREADQSEVLRNENEALVTEREALLKRISTLEDANKQIEARPQRELANKMQIIERLKGAYTRKEEEFDNLMDTKIALSMEIKAYRMMLDQEETRLTSHGWKSPAKKRKRTDGSAVVVADTSASGKDEESHPETAVNDGAMVDDASSSSGSADKLTIESIDIVGSCLVIRSVVAEEVSLAGWRLTNSKHEHYFLFPADMSLDPGDAVHIFGSEQQAEAAGLANSLVWESNLVSVQEGDKALLLSPSGNTVSSATILAASEGSPQRRGCFLM